MMKYPTQVKIGMHALITGNALWELNKYFRYHIKTIGWRLT